MHCFYMRLCRYSRARNLKSKKLAFKRFSPLQSFGKRTSILSASSSHIQVLFQRAHPIKRLLAYSDPRLCILRILPAGCNRAIHDHHPRFGHRHHPQCRHWQLPSHCPSSLLNLPRILLQQRLVSAPKEMIDALTLIEDRPTPISFAHHPCHSEEVIFANECSQQEPPSYGQQDVDYRRRYKYSLPAQDGRREGSLVSVEVFADEDTSSCARDPGTKRRRYAFTYSNF